MPVERSSNTAISFILGVVVVVLAGVVFYVWNGNSFSTGHKAEIKIELPKAKN